MNIKKISFSVIAAILILLTAFLLPTQVMAETVSSATFDEAYTEAPSTKDEEKVDQGNIIGEDTSLRDEYTKYFITDAGCTIAAQYAVPVHYKDDSGEYVDYDNSLISSQAVVSDSSIDEATPDEISSYSLRAPEEASQTEEILVNKKSNSKVSHFKKTGKAKLIEITRDNHTISWGYSGANIVTAKEQKQKNIEKLTGNDAYMALPNLSSTVVYEDIYNNVDLEVINSTTGVKENIILKASNAKNVFKIEYNIGDLTAESADIHTIELKDSSGKAVYTITAPYMQDAKGKTSEALELKILSNNKGKLSVKLTADKTWLKDKSRVYPVTVDPAFQYGQDLGDSVYTAYMNSASENTRFDAEGSIYVGRPNIDNGIRRSVVRIQNLPSLNIGDMIVHADFAMNQVTNNATVDMYVGVYEISETFNKEKIVWSNPLACSNVLIDYEKIPQKTKEWRIWDVTELVKKWYNGSANNGFYLKMMDEANTYQGLQFTSTLYPTAAGYRPCFILTYRNNKGLENYWSYTTINCGRAGTAYINDYSGNLVFEMPLASTASPVLSAGLSYYYNSYYAGQKYKDSYPYTGRGWKMNIQQTLYETSEDLLGEFQEDYPYVYTDADGTEHYFTPKEEDGITKYYDEDGLNLELQIPKTSKNYYYVIVNKDNEKFHFSQDGLLTKIENKSGQCVSISYSGNKITSIKDAEGDTITYEVNDTTNNYIEKVTNPDGKVTTVNFSGSKIGGITYNDGKSISFTYDDAGKLLSVTDVDGSKVKFTYSSHGSKGVTSVCEYGTEGTQGQNITFDRTKYNTTTIRTSGTDGIFNNSNDIITTCQFDDWGKLTSTNSKTVEGEYLSASDATYTSSTLNSDASNIKSINKVSQAYTVGANTENLLKNHNLENYDDNDVVLNWTKLKWGSGEADFDVERTSAVDDSTVVAENILFGQDSLKIKVNSVTNDARGRVYQKIDKAYLEQGETYTLSCYVKVTDMKSIADDDVYGAVIGVTTFFDDKSLNYYSEHISKVTDKTINSGFRRLSVTFKVPDDTDFTSINVNLAIHSATGTAYFDGVQLEKASAAGHYNMLENSSFELAGPASWSETNTAEKDGRCTTAMDGNASLYVTGDVATAKNFHQDVIINGTEADTYILSGWGYGNTVPNETNSSYFELRARVYYSNGTNVMKNSAPFNTTVSGWQYASFAFNLDNGNESADDVTPVKIRVYAISFRQGNTVCFDNLLLTKEAVPSYTYDDEGNLISVVANAEQNSTYKYSDNLLTSYVEPSGSEYKYTYDSYERIKTVTTASETTYTYNYDSKGNVTTVLARGGTGLNIQAGASYGYPDTNDTEYSVVTYDQNGYAASTQVYDAKDGTLISAKDVNGNTTEYTYNDKNDLVTDIVSGNQSVSYDYSDDFKNYKSITHGDTKYSFAYDEYGNKTTVKAGNHTLATYKYLSNNGNLQTVSYGNGDNVSYMYDNFGNVSLLVKDNKNVAKFYSNGRGDIIRSVDLVNDLETCLNYDTTGRLISKDVYSTDPNTNSDTWRRGFEYDYDLNNNLTRLSFIDSNGTRNTTQYRYGADNLPSNLMLSNGESLMYEYDGLNRLTKKTLYTDNNIVSVYTYAPSVRGSSYTTSAIATEETDAFAYKYDYDKSGNIKAIYKGILTGYVYSYSSTPSVEYKYDSYGQLTTVNDYSKNEQYSYTYDKDGNITSLKRYSMNGSGWFPVSTLESHSYTYADSSGWGDLLTAYDGETITYDAIGNPLTYRDGMTMTWQNGRELKSLSKDGKTYNFTYDPSGLRTKKSITTSSGSTTNVEYIYEGGQLMQMTYGNYVLDFSYDANGTPVAFHVDNGGTVDKYYYYGVNSRGDVEALYNADGTLHARYEYDAYGKLIAATQPNGTEITSTYAIAVLNPLRYRSYVYDNETGLYYLQSRYYDPTTCRFVNADGQLNTNGIIGFNQFAYCNNNPILMADSEGNIPFFAITAAIGAVVGAVAGGVMAAANGGNVWAGIGVGAAAGALIGTGAGMAAGVALAGSITATAAQVAIGAGALGATVATGGLGAGVKMIADNITQAVNTSPQVFWSGGDIAKNGAKEVANTVGGKTLEMTKLGQYLENTNASIDAWKAASTNFANVAKASGCANYSIQNATGVNLKSIWATIEYPILSGSNITYGVVSADGTIQLLP